MKLSEIKGEAALDVLADILEPATEILADEEIKAATEDKNVKLIQIVKIAIKKHKRAVIEMLAAVEQEDPDEYIKKVNVLTVPMKFIELLQDENLREVLPLPDQKKGETPSGSATANTKAKKK